jgi:mRNA interferase HicA
VPFTGSKLTSYSACVKCREFKKLIERLGKARGTSVHTEKKGKGSHKRLWYGERHTTIVDEGRELTKGAVDGMLKQLGLTLKDIGR